MVWRGMRTIGEKTQKSINGYIEIIDDKLKNK